MKNRIYSMALAAMITLPGMAQELRTSYFMQTSDNRHEMNPALLDKPYVSMPLLLGNVNLGMTGNVGLKNFVYKMDPSWMGYGVNRRTLTTFMHPDVDAGRFLDDLSDQTRMNVFLKYQLFGMGFRAFGGMNSVELNLRSSVNASISKSLFTFMKTPESLTDHTVSDVGLRTENYLELGLGHSHRINEKLTVGAKVKLLFGIAYADFDVERLNLHMKDDYWMVDGDARLSASLMNSTLDYESTDKNYVDEHGTLTGRRRIKGIDEVKPGLSGFGLGFDLGATYQLLPDLTLSVALTDLGFMSWSNARQASSAGTWRFDGFKNPIYCGGTNTGDNKLGDQFDALSDDLENLFSVYEEEVPKKTDTRALTATFNAGAEYTLPVYRNLRFGFLYTGRFAGSKYAWHQGMLTASVRPVKWFEATVNMAGSTSGFSGGLVVDCRFRHFNLFVGTDRFFGKVSKQFIPLNKMNGNMSLGMSFPL